MCTPPEAVAARDLGLRILRDQNYLAAEQAFDDAIELDLQDATTLVGRGLCRVMLQRYADAEADFARLLNDEAEFSSEQKATAARFRALARQQQENIDGALRDYTQAIDLGLADPEVFANRGMLLLRRSLDSAARQDAERAHELTTDSEALRELDAALQESSAGRHA